jgi:outer membrane receptor protein involved in Fe transport
MGMWRTTRAAAGVAVCAALLAWPAGAQEGVHVGSVSGRVADEQGAVVPGARVAARHLETNQALELQSDGGGRFRFPYLRVGRYAIVVTRDGFAEASRVLTVTGGSAFELPIVLRLAGLDARVSVSAEVPVIEAARSQLAGTVLSEEIASVPLNGRHFLDLALLVPGVSPPNIAGTALFAETSAVPGVGLSVSSQRNLSNNFTVDGLSANDDAAGLSSIPVGVDAVEQLQVVTSGGQAELGRALGGFVNVITRSGTNTLRGDVYGFFRDRALNAANALTGNRLPMTQTHAGGTLGGPLRRDRTFFFVNGEHRNLEQAGLTTIAPASVEAINARLAAVGYAGVPVATGVFDSAVQTRQWLAKADHQVSGTYHVSGRVSVYDVDASRARNAGALNAPSAAAGLDNRDVAVAFGQTVTLSDRTVNETRAQVARGNLHAPPEDGVGPAVAIAGVATFGTSSSNPMARLNHLYQVVNTLSHQRGAHAFRAGVDLLVNDDTITFPRSVRGAYTFSSLASFLAGTYNTSGFTQTFGASRVEQVSPALGLYAQDEWKRGDRLTFNLGLRYDLQRLETVQADANNLAPRVGVAWTPGASRRSVVRGGAGLYFDRVPLRAVANALLSAGNTTDPAQLRQTSVSLSPVQTGAPSFPAVLAAAVPTSTLVNFTTMDRGLQHAYSRQASVEFEQQLGAQTTVSVAYQYVRGAHLLMQINQNVPSCVASGGNNGCRPNPSYANDNRYSSAGSSTFHGLLMSFVARPSSWGRFRASYTLSKSRNNVGEAFFSSPIDPLDLSKDWGRSDGDQRHRLVLDGSLRLPGGFDASGLAQYYSALPLNVTSGVTTVQGTAGRPIVDGAFIARNAGRGSDFFSVGARVSRVFTAGRVRIEALAEAFNVTNRRNVLTRNATFGTGAYPSSPLPSFNQPTAVGDPRSLQLGVRLRF